MIKIKEPAGRVDKYMRQARGMIMKPARRESSHKQQARRVVDQPAWCQANPDGAAQRLSLQMKRGGGSVKEPARGRVVMEIAPAEERRAHEQPARRVAVVPEECLDSQDGVMQCTSLSVMVSWHQAVRI